VKTLFALVCLACVPGTAAAQAAIAGTVTDPSGAVMPRVVVEVSSPVLIETSRSVTTDDAGRYRIEDLRPGMYTIRFRRPDWRSIEREGVALNAATTTMLDAQLSPAAVLESIEVTPLSPRDRHSPGHVLALDGDELSLIPTVRSYNALLGLVPGVVTSTNDVVNGTAATSFPIHGGRANEGRLLVNGLVVGSPPNGNSATSYSVNVTDAEQVTFTAASGLGERETSGLVIDLVPRVGGNTTAGVVYISATGKNLQADNVTAALRAQNVRPATPLSNVYDLWGSIGGPVLRDRVWYFANAHTGGFRRESANVYYNLNAGIPTAWRYLPDLDRPAYSDRTYENASARLTWQATAHNQISGFWDKQWLCRTCTGATPGLAEPATTSPEAVGVLGRPLDVWQVRWTSPRTTKVMVEAGASGTSFGVGNFERDPNPTRDLIRVVEQCAAGCAANGGIPGLVYRSQDFSVAHTAAYAWNASLSFVTGTRGMKVGYQHTSMVDDRTWYTNNQNLSYRFDNGVPNQLTQSISPWVNDARAASDALFAQGRWTERRVTVEAALRADRAASWFPSQQEGPSRFLPTVLVIPATRGVDSYYDITPRVGVSYDLGGDSATILRLTIGKYLEGVGTNGIYANTNPSLRLPQTTPTLGPAGVMRAWSDSNGNFVADCDLSNAAAQDLRAAGGDVCGVMTNTSFGSYVLTNNFDPRVLGGWGIRPSDWNVEASLEQTIGGRSTVRVSYIHRAFQGFFAVDNLAVQRSDFTPYSIVAPSDPRLPGGGGYRISNLFDVAPEKSGQIDNLVTTADDYGDWSQSFNGMDLTLDLRAIGELRFAGGASIGQTTADSCEVRASLPELATTTTGTSPFGAGLLTSAVTPVSPYCRVAFGMQTQFRALSSYLIPKLHADVAVTIQSKPGAMLAANYAVPREAVAAALGRNPAGNVPNTTVNLVAPGTMYGDRINEVDVRFARTMKIGGPRVTLAAELYNALNSSAVLTYNPAFVPGGTWLQPTAILTPRTGRLTAEVRF
jgi:hypothetical protein